MHIVKLALLLLFLLNSTSSAVIPDPEFDDYHSWLYPNRSIIMRKALPPGANTTWDRYFRSWGMDYQVEMAKKELALATAKVIDQQLLGFDVKERFTVYFDIFIVNCDYGLKGFKEVNFHEDYVPKKAKFGWIGDYCKSEAISNWCDKGDRRKITMTANSTTTTGTKFQANVTFICPFSFYYLLLDTFRTVTKDSWEFKPAFWVTVGVGATVTVAGIVAAIYFLCERRNRKLSRLANNEYWGRYRSKLTYQSYSIPDVESFAEQGGQEGEGEGEAMEMVELAGIKEDEDKVEEVEFVAVRK